MKKLLPGELRFIVKRIDKVFRVYDRAKANFPYKSTELGDVIQDVTEPEAQAECDRLNKKYVKTEARVEKKRELVSSAAETIEAPRAQDMVSSGPDEYETFEEEPLEEVEAYGELSEEERKKMEASLDL